MMRDDLSKRSIGRRRLRLLSDGQQASPPVGRTKLAAIQGMAFLQACTVRWSEADNASMHRGPELDFHGMFCVHVSLMVPSDPV